MVPNIHTHDSKMNLFELVANFFSNSFQSIKCGSTDFTNLIELKFQEPYFQTTVFFETKPPSELCPIITNNSRENEEDFKYFYNHMRLTFSR